MENLEITRKIEEIRNSLNELETLIKNSSKENIKNVDYITKNDNKEKKSTSDPKYYKIKSIKSKDDINNKQNKEEILKKIINSLFGFENLNIDREDNKKSEHKTNDYKYFTPIQTEFPYYDGGKLYRLNNEYTEKFFKKFKINEITYRYKCFEIYPKNVYLIHSLGSDYDGKFYITCDNHIDVIISPTEITNSKIKELIQFNHDFLEEVVTILELYKD